MKQIFPYVVCIAAILSGPVYGKDRHYFDDLKVPETQQDLLAIQKALQDQLSRARAATVCVKLKEGSGSGVIISEDGLVLTAAHVSGAVKQTLAVVLEDGREYEAISLGLNSENDAAMLQILSEEKFPFVEVEEKSSDGSPASRLGDWVFSLGHSGGFDQARGSVVRLGRVVKVSDTTVRTDCLLIGGDSGGPLFDLNGVLIAIHSRVGHLASQNMHVPIQAFHAHWDELKGSEFIGEGPFATQAVAGSGFMGLAAEVDTNGLRVTAVEEGCAAHEAGIKVGDVLLEVHGSKTQTKEDLAKVMATLASGEVIEVRLQRGGAEQTLELTLKAK